MDSPKKRFIRAIYKIGIGNVSLNLSGLIIVMVATRYISIAEVGIYVIFDIVCSVLEAIGGLGIRMAVVKFLVDENNQEKRRVIILTCTIYIFLSTFLLAILTIICNEIFTLFPTKTIGFLFAGYFLFRSSFQYFNGCVFQGLQRYGDISKSYIVHSISKIILVIIALVIIDGDFNIFLIAVLVSFLIPFAMQLKLLNKDIRLGFRFDQTVFKKMLQFSFPLYLNNLLMLLYHRGYTMLLAILLDTTAVAYYNIAMRIPNVVNSFQTVYITVFFPTIVECLKDKKEKAVLLLRTSILAIFSAVIPISLLFCVFRNEIISMLFSEKYLVISSATFLLLFRSAITFSGPLMGNSLIALGHCKAPLKINTMNVIVGISASYMLIPRFGFMGVVYVAFVVSILGFSANYVYLRSKGFCLNLGPILFFATLPSIALFMNIELLKVSNLNYLLWVIIMIGECYLIYNLLAHANLRLGDIRRIF